MPPDPLQSPRGDAHGADPGRLQVRASRSARYLGIDPGSHLTGVALLDDHDHLELHTLKLIAGDPAARLADLQQQLARPLNMPPGAVRCAVVEKPTVRGKSNALTLAAFGVCLAQTYAWCRCPTFELPSNTWRSHTPLGGNARKEQVVAWVEQHFDLASGSVQGDAGQAAGCAWAARELARRHDRSAAA